MLRKTTMVLATAAALGSSLTDATAIGGAGFGMGHMGAGSGAHIGLLSGRMEAFERGPLVRGGRRDREFRRDYCGGWGNDNDDGDPCN
jgi:hypothetical protein